MTRNPNMREAILSAAELLFSTRGFNAVSIRDIALEAGANPGSITYHFKSKDGLLLEIYKRHCGPMNKRRIELLVAATRVRDGQDRLEAIVRAYVQPAFSSSSDLAGGGARFTRLRAVMSAEGNAVVGRIIAESLVRAGADIVIASRKAKACEECAAALRSHAAWCTIRGSFFWTSPQPDSTPSLAWRCGRC